MAACWPSAPIYTLLYDRRGTQDRFAGHRVVTSPLQRLPVRQGGFRRLLPLFPWAIGRLDVSGHDLVVSSSSAFAHGVQAAPGAVHVCYCHTPFRYAWYERDRAEAEVPRLLRPALRRTLGRVRRWDLDASRNVSVYIANAEVTRERIARFYGREASIVHPPVEVDRFAAGEPGDAFLVVTELVPHKRVEFALRAARTAGRPVDVVGEGPDLARLQALYGDSATFHGRLGDAELAAMYSRALALVVPNEEEFGIAAVEAQAAGRPVLAVDAGGPRETVVEGVSGVRVPFGDQDAMAEAMREVDFRSFDPAAIRANAERFSVDKFQQRLRVAVAAAQRSAATAA